MFLVPEQISYLSSSSMFFAAMNQEGIEDLLNGKDLTPDSAKVAIAYLKPNDIEQMVDIGAIAVLLKCIQKNYKKDAALSQKSLKCLSAILTDGAKVDQFVKKHGIEILKEGMLTFVTTNKECLTEILIVLRQVVRAKSALFRVAERALIPVMFTVYDFYSDKDGVIITHLFITLTTLFKADARLRQLMLQQGLLKVLCHSLEMSNTRSPHVLKSTLFTLRSLFLFSFDASLFFECRGVELLLECTQTHLTNPRIEHAIMSVLTLIARVATLPTIHYNPLVTRSLEILSHYSKLALEPQHTLFIIQFSLAIIISVLLKDSSLVSTLMSNNGCKIVLEIIDIFLSPIADPQINCFPPLRLALGIIAFITKEPTGAVRLLEANVLPLLLSVCDVGYEQDQGRQSTALIMNASAAIAFLSNEPTFFDHLASSDVIICLLSLITAGLNFLGTSPSPILTSCLLSTFENVLAVLMSIVHKTQSESNKNSELSLLLLDAATTIVTTDQQPTAGQEGEHLQIPMTPRSFASFAPFSNCSTLLSLLLTSSGLIAESTSASVIVKRCSDIIACFSLAWLDKSNMKDKDSSDDQNEADAPLPSTHSTKTANQLVSGFVLTSFCEHALPILGRALSAHFKLPSQTTLTLSAMASISAALCNLTLHPSIVAELPAQCQQTIDDLLELARVCDGLSESAEEREDGDDQDSEFQMLLDSIQKADGFEASEPLSPPEQSPQASFNKTDRAHLTRPPSLQSEHENFQEWLKKVKCNLWDCLVNILSVDKEQSSPMLHSFLTHGGVSSLLTQLTFLNEENRMTLPTSSLHASNYSKSIQNISTASNLVLCSSLSSVTALVCQNPKGVKEFEENDGSGQILELLEFIFDSNQDKLGQSTQTIFEDVEQTGSQTDSPKTPKQTKSSRSARQINKKLVHACCVSLMNLLQSCPSTVQSILQFEFQNNAHTSFVHFMLNISAVFVSSHLDIALSAVQCVCLMCEGLPFTEWVDFDSSEYTTMIEEMGVGKKRTTEFQIRRGKRPSRGTLPQQEIKNGSEDTEQQKKAKKPRKGPKIKPEEQILQIPIALNSVITLCTSILTRCTEGLNTWKEQASLSEEEQDKALIDSIPSISVCLSFPSLVVRLLVCLSMSASPILAKQKEKRHRRIQRQEKKLESIENDDSAPDDIALSENSSQNEDSDEQNFDSLFDSFLFSALSSYLHAALHSRELFPSEPQSSAQPSSSPLSNSQTPTKRGSVAKNSKMGQISSVPQSRLGELFPLFHNSLQFMLQSVEWVSDSELGEEGRAICETIVEMVEVLVRNEEEKKEEGGIEEEGKYKQDPFEAQDSSDEEKGSERGDEKDENEQLQPKQNPTDPNTKSPAPQNPNISSQPLADQKLKVADKISDPDLVLLSLSFSLLSFLSKPESYRASFVHASLSSHSTLLNIEAALSLISTIFLSTSPALAHSPPTTILVRVAFLLRSFEGVVVLLGNLLSSQHVFVMLDIVRFLSGKITKVPSQQPQSSRSSFSGRMDSKNVILERKHTNATLQSKKQPKTTGSVNTQSSSVVPKESGTPNPNLRPSRILFSVVDVLESQTKARDTTVEPFQLPTQISLSVIRLLVLMAKEVSICPLFFPRASSLVTVLTSLCAPPPTTQLLSQLRTSSSLLLSSLSAHPPNAERIAKSGGIDLTQNLLTFVARRVFPTFMPSARSSSPSPIPSRSSPPPTKTATGTEASTHLEAISTFLCTLSAICSASGSLPVAHKLKTVPVVLRILSCSLAPNAITNEQAREREKYDLRTDVISCLCVLTQSKQLEHDFAQANGSTLLLQVLEERTKDGVRIRKEMMDNVFATPQPFSSNDRITLQDVEDEMEKACIVLVSVSQSALKSRLEMLKNRGIQIVKSSLESIVPNRENEKLADLLELLMKLMNPSFVTYQEKQKENRVKVNQKDLIHMSSSRMSLTYSPKGSARIGSREPGSGYTTPGTLPSPGITKLWVGKK
ncbi:hypothetical protein BLNAU_6943 [Blattamonas nauphoetae]|uniref:HECT-type E3 ubiquitin transferase n=1 Tax=Blattamonas nauphoetae TaxID=2049346 RepID=A0ABQ9Y2Q5_9EUKA|nr:hypothetical protein BLNAU_6943 [Blattamonas nauphoetae]